MDDLSAKLSDILSDKESMNKVKALAESLLSKEESEKTESSGGNFGMNPDEINGILSVLGHLKNREDDKRTALLAALKPNLSKEKQKKVDTAIKLLKLIDMLPLLKESGILNLL